MCVNTFKLILGVGFVSFIVGCGEPAFNPNIQNIVFVDGEPFRIPAGSRSTPHTYTNAILDQEKMAAYRKNGLDCRIGDILWMENSVATEGVKIMNSGDEERAYAFVALAAKDGKSGCAHPLSNREYDYYKEKESERSARAYAARVAIAKNIGNSTPKTYNVIHSGSINQNVNVNSTGAVNPYQY